MWENIAVRLEGSLVVLEPLESRYQESLYQIAKDERIWRWMPYNAAKSRGSFSTWFNDALKASDAGSEAAFAVFDVNTGAPVGSTRYLTLRPAHRTLEIGWTWFSYSVWGTGINTEAKLLLMEHAFECLDCLRVEFKTDSRNERSRAALEGLPTRFEGILRKHMLVRGGERRDSAYYSVVDEEWPEIKASLERRLKLVSQER